MPPPTIPQALSTIHQRWPEAWPTGDEDEQQPVFILAAGWRSGSTLLQRMLFPQVFMWGEPFGQGGPIAALAETLRVFTPTYPEPHFFQNDRGPEQLSREFIANLFPNVAELRAAHRAWFWTLFERPALAAGIKSWGFKEVRLSIDHAHYLKWLFPQARFLLLIRNPYDAFRSLAARRRAGWRWFRHWPDEPLTTHLFAKHWQQLASGFAKRHAEVDGLLVRYEDLAAGRFEPIEDYLEFRLSREAADIRPHDGPPPIPLEQITPHDLSILEEQLGLTARKLGYESPGGSAVRTERDGRASSQWSAQRTLRGWDEITTEDVRQPNGPRVIRETVEQSRCAILMPVGSTPARQCEESLRALERRGYPIRRVHGYAAIDQARNRLATDAVRAGFLETLWIDSDVAFHPDAVEQLRSHGEPLICGIYPKKGKRAVACHVLPGTESLIFGEGGGVMEILYGATGFMLVRRQVYEDVQARLPIPIANEERGDEVIPFFQPLIRPDGAGHWYLAEDFAFCHRAREAGYRVMADTTVRLWHLGEYPFGWEDAGREPGRFGSFQIELH